MFKVGSETKEYIRFLIITCNVTEKSSLHTVGMISVFILFDLSLHRDNSTIASDDTFTHSHGLLYIRLLYMGGQSRQRRLSNT